MSFSGVLGSQVMRDMIALYKDQWSEVNFGTRPSMNVTYDRALIGNAGSQLKEQILVYIDNKDAKAFDLGGASNEIMWEHKILATINIYTNKSEKRSEQLVDAIEALNKRNLLITTRVDDDGMSVPIDRRIKVGQTRNLSSQNRGVYHHIVDIEITEYVKNKRTF